MNTQCCIKIILGIPSSGTLQTQGECGLGAANPRLFQHSVKSINKKLINNEVGQQVIHQLEIHQLEIYQQL